MKAKQVAAPVAKQVKPKQAKGLKGAKEAYAKAGAISSSNGEVFDGKARVKKPAPRFELLRVTATGYRKVPGSLTPEMMLNRLKACAPGALKMLVRDFKGTAHEVVAGEARIVVKDGETTIRPKKGARYIPVTGGQAVQVNPAMKRLSETAAGLAAVRAAPVKATVHKACEPVRPSHDAGDFRRVVQEHARVNGALAEAFRRAVNEGLERACTRP